MNYNKVTGMYEGYIYKISNDINDKVYIGQTYTTLSVRWSGHKYQAKKHCSTDYLHNSMYLHGIEHFQIELIEKIERDNIRDFINVLDQKEIYYISLYDSYYNGYNSTKGGRDAMDHQKRKVVKYSLDGEQLSEYESIDCLKTEFDSVRSIYDCCHGKCKYAYGYIWRYFEDDLYKYSLPNNAEKQEAIVRYKALFPIDKYDYKGNKIYTYKNVDEAAELENVDRKKIIGCCTGKNVYCNMHIFRFYTDSFDTFKTITHKPKVVEQYDLFGNFITAYESAREAGRAVGISYQCIVGVCNGKHKTAGKYVWRYFIDNSIT